MKLGKKTAQEYLDGYIGIVARMPCIPREFHPTDMGLCASGTAHDI